MWKYVECADFERDLVALSEKGGARKFLTWHRFQKKTDIFPSFFGSPDVKNAGFVAAKCTFTNHAKWKPQKSNVFFLDPDD